MMYYFWLGAEAEPIQRRELRNIISERFSNTLEYLSDERS